MITQQEALERWDYDPDTGHLTHRTSIGGTTKGAIAGHANTKGYLQVCFKGKFYTAHRIAWLMTHGEFPKGQIDHINRIKDDNRIENMRDVDQTTNQRNAKQRADNKSGITGVIRDKVKGKWQAYIIVKKKQIHLGYYDCKFEAGRKREMAEVIYGFHPQHGRAVA